MMENEPRSIMDDEYLQRLDAETVSKTGKASWKDLLYLHRTFLTSYVRCVVDPKSLGYEDIFDADDLRRRRHDYLSAAFDLPRKTISWCLENVILEDWTRDSAFNAYIKYGDVENVVMAFFGSLVFERWKVFVKEDTSHLFRAEEQKSEAKKMGKLYVVRGIPGSGKSTWVRNNLPGTFHLENDMFHMRNGSYEWSPENMDSAIAWCSETAKRALSLGMDVVVSNTFVRRKYVEAYRKIAEETGSSFEVIRCTGNFGNVHHVPEKTLEGMRRSFEDYPGEELV